MEKRKDAWVIDGNETYESQYNEYLDITIPNSKTMQFATTTAVTMKTTTTSAEMAGLGVGQLKVTLMRKMTPPTTAMATTTTMTTTIC